MTNPPAEAFGGISRANSSTEPWPACRSCGSRGLGRHTIPLSRAGCSRSTATPEGIPAGAMTLTGLTNPNLALEPGSRHRQFMASSPLQPSFAWRSSSSTDAINEQHLSGLDCSGAAQHAWAQHGAGRHSLGPETRQYPGRLLDGTDKAHFQPSAHPTRNKRRSNLHIIEVSCGVYCVYFEKIKLT